MGKKEWSVLLHDPLGDDGTILHVSGTAEWIAGPDADGVLVANELRLGEPKCLDHEYNDDHDECWECVARLLLVNGRIFVADNRSCGGMNVNFEGIYDRAAPATTDTSKDGP